MALMVRCYHRNVGYILGDIFPEWWHKAGVPACPHCRMKWAEAHRNDWEFPIPYEVFATGIRLSIENCVVYVSIDTSGD